jgi:hypothetical protein
VQEDNNEYVDEIRRIQSGKRPIEGRLQKVRGKRALQMLVTEARARTVQ